MLLVSYSSLHYSRNAHKFVLSIRSFVTYWQYSKLPEYNKKKFWEELIVYFQFDATWTAYKTTRSAILLLLRVYSWSGNIFPGRCLATRGRYACRHTD
jgi:hypothetical protein